MVSHVGQRCMIAAAQLRQSGAWWAWWVSVEAWSWTLPAKLFLPVTLFGPILRLLMARTYPLLVGSGTGQRGKRYQPKGGDLLPGVDAQALFYALTPSSFREDDF
jgi:hypothetical protein